MKKPRKSIKKLEESEDEVYPIMVQQITDKQLEDSHHTEFHNTPSLLFQPVNHWSLPKSSKKNSFQPVTLLNQKTTIKNINKQKNSDLPAGLLDPKRVSKKETF